MEHETDRPGKSLFLRELIGDMPLKVRLAESKSLDDAVQMAVKYEPTVKDVQQTTSSTQRINRSGQSPSDETIATAQSHSEQESLRELKNLLERNTQVMSDMVSLMREMNVNHSKPSRGCGGGRWNRNTCWECRKIGNLCGSCLNLKKNNEPEN